MADFKRGDYIKGTVVQRRNAEDWRKIAQEFFDGVICAGGFDPSIGLLACKARVICDNSFVELDYFLHEKYCSNTRWEGGSKQLVARVRARECDFGKDDAPWKTLGEMDLEHGRNKKHV